MIDKCVKCADEKIVSGETFGLDDIPDAVITIPYFQVFTTPQGSVGGVCSIRVCLAHRKKELRPPKIQPVQGVLLNPNGERNG